MTKPVDKTDSNCMHTLTPHLICADAIAAMEYYKKAFNAVEEMKLLAPNGQLVHGSMRIGDSMLMLAEECPEFGNFAPKEANASSVYLHLMVPDVDASMKQAEAAGAKITMPATDMFWGDRYGQLIDPFGHRWSVATHIKDMTPEEIQEAATKACGPQAK